ncbi:MAG: hypothetical protein II920_05950 [Clostridia bacterium]|nr:hypothetical protein [Clostridia bacterium]
MKRRLCALLLALAVLISLDALAQGEEAPARDRYEIDAVYLENEQALAVSLVFTYTNRTGQALDRVWFNVYSNLFRRQSTLPYDNATLEAAFPWGYAPSGTEFTDIRFNGKRARYGFAGSAETFLGVECALENGESGVFEFYYTLLLSENRAFQGCGEDLRLTLFYPSVCVWDGEFVALNASRVSQFLYSEPADFAMTISLPKGYEPASGGEISLLSSDESGNRYSVKIENASELGLIASRRFYVYEAETPSGHKIRALGNERSRCKTMLADAMRALALYEEWFGVLPFEKTDIVLSPAAASLSLPGLLVVGAQDEDDLLVEYLMARQYFGCAVLTDPETDPFLTCGVSCYAALLTVKALEGEAALNATLRSYIQPALKLTVPGGLTPDSALSRFASAYEFDLVVKKRGAAVMHEMCLSMGEEEFMAALRRYYEGSAGSVANIERFVDALNGESGQNRGSALIAWLMTIDEYVQHDGDIY